MKVTPSEKAVQRAVSVFQDHGGTLTSKDVIGAGVHYSTLYWMRDTGMLDRISRGVYRLSDEKGVSAPDIATVASRAPESVLCLVSALAFHEVTTQVPNVVSIALPHKAWQPRIDHPPIRVYRMSGAALTEGVEEHALDGVTIRVFSLPKTVADCFKFRNKIGLDVAVEALKEAVRDRRASPAEIMRYADIDRVAKVIRPYIEALQ